jgi:hypothetical protein
VKTVIRDQVAQRLEFEEFFRAEYPGLLRAFYLLRRTGLMPRNSRQRR